MVVGWQGANFPSVPRQQSPRRVDVYFSSWRIRAGRISENIFEVACCHFFDTDYGNIIAGQDSWALECYDGVGL